MDTNDFHTTPSLVVAVDAMTDADWATHMHWVNLGLGAGWNSASGSENDLHRLGFWLGAGTQTDADADQDQVHPADVATCEHLGYRVAVVSRQMVAGRAAAQPNPAASSLAASSAPAR